MDPSALIFVALAVAWAAYLIPRALEHHEEGKRTRTIDRFSHGLRILARREPRSRRRSELVTVADVAPEPVPAPLTERERRALRRAFARAARRRRRVLDLLGVAVVAVAAAVLLGHLTWHWLGAPVAAVLVWLLACRRMRVREKRLLAPAPAAPAVSATSRADLAFAAGVPVAAVTWTLDDDPTSDVPVVALPLLDAETSGAGGGAAGAVAPGGWELQPLLVPTYVAKDTAPRSVRTIDLDSTGVFSAGRSASDSALVRGSEQETADADAGAPDVRRVAGS